MNVNERSNELSKRSGTKLFQNVRKRSQKSNVNYQNKTNTRKILKIEHYFAFYMIPLDFSLYAMKILNADGYFQFLRYHLRMVNADDPSAKRISIVLFILVPLLIYSVIKII